MRPRQQLSLSQFSSLSGHLRLFLPLSFLLLGLAVGCQAEQQQPVGQPKAGTPAGPAQAGSPPPQSPAVRAASPSPSPFAGAAGELEAVYTATDYDFTGPDSLPAGVVRFRLMNKGHEPHHLQLIKLQPGQTLDDVLAAVVASPDPTRLQDELRAFGLDAGGPNIIAPDEEGYATVTLDPGNYLMACFIPDHEGTPHVLKGMIQGLRVTDRPPVVEAEPQTPLTIQMVDFAYSLPAAIPAGRQTVRVTNAGQQYHEAALIRLKTGKSAQDYIAATHPKLEHERPGTGIGGLAGLAEGRQGYFTADFTPGAYALICYLPDIQSEQRHFEKGMVTEFTVK